MAHKQAPEEGKQQDDYYAKVYSPTFLSRVYDLYVLRFNMRYIWGCRTDKILLPFFSENFSRNHLDVGVATGYFPAAALAHPWRRNAKQKLALLDINGNSLAAAKARILATAPGVEVETVEADVKAELPKELQGREFESISMFNLFHCVPGKDKVRAISTYKEVLAEDGVLAGCTVLGEKGATNWVNRRYVRAYNRRGIFNNLEDEREAFESVLKKEFEDVETWVFGMTLVFRATGPRKGAVVDLN